MSSDWHSGHRLPVVILTGVRETEDCAAGSAPRECASLTASCIKWLLPSQARRVEFDRQSAPRIQPEATAFCWYRHIRWHIPLLLAPPLACPWSEQDHLRQ